ncbi:MAG: undecaprenyl-diphosphate phosphatase [Planctomycetota bacterium]|nr:undecaprenyl-diphosphate phosphatase [Planctomycetota bacterium]
MNALHAIILGLVEGITEYLPVSSTGHLIIASSLMGLDRDPATREAVNAFNIVIQGGAILAVAGLYWPRLVQMLRGLAGRDAAGARLVLNLALAFVPAAAIGVLLDDLIEALLFRPIPVLAALAAGGVWMIWIERRRRSDELLGERTALVPGGSTIDTMTPVQALGIGFFQCIAMWPGTSRSMMTIGGAMMLGLRPAEAAQFSFLLGLPTLTAACLFKLVKNLKHAHDTGAPNLFEQLGGLNVTLGILVATVSAAFAVRWLVGFLNRHGLAAFGWYRLALCIVLGSLMAGGIVRLSPG